MVSKNSKKTEKKLNEKRIENGKHPYVPSLLYHYKKIIIPKMLKEFNYSNIMEVPKISSICLNIGLGDAKTNSKGLESAGMEISTVFKLTASSIMNYLSSEKSSGRIDLNSSCE